MLQMFREVDTSCCDLLRPRLPRISWGCSSLLQLALGRAMLHTSLGREECVLGGGGCSDGDAIMETFSLGDTIRVELDLRDESGVSTVSAAFYELNEGKGFMMRGESEGERELTMVLSQEVTNDMPPGEYRCEGVTVYDVHLNRKTFHPDIRFRVVNIPGDHEGPELFGWRVSKE